MKTLNGKTCGKFMGISDDIYSISAKYIEPYILYGVWKWVSWRSAPDVS